MLDKGRDPSLYSIICTKLDVKGSQFFSEQLRILHITHVVTPPHQKQHFHVEDDEKHDVGYDRNNKKEIAALYYKLNTSEPMIY